MSPAHRAAWPDSPRAGAGPRSWEHLQLGGEGFLEDRTGLFARADEEDGEWHPVVIAWNAKADDYPKKPVELAQFCEREGLLESSFLAAGAAGRDGHAG